ncbi:hypothetical protein DNTS_017533 [Danionella cerebrum]|uniref:Uncharacterized protein n=1 Tax=Danionella cerebrum TaxID=2873325 RepID=A0A553QK09_9TELE|nr:hypothetical protein DNTS_017533 [Danionella translucida]
MLTLILKTISNFRNNHQLPLFTRRASSPSGAWRHRVGGSVTPGTGLDPETHGR